MTRLLTMLFDLLSTYEQSVPLGIPSPLMLPVSSSCRKGW